jgi:hypothetical protein
MNRRLGVTIRLDLIRSTRTGACRNDAGPNAIVDDLVVHGSQAACAEHRARYTAGGVTTVVRVLPLGTGMETAVAATSIPETAAAPGR